jgi:hypothetical protein
VPSAVAGFSSFALTDHIPDGEVVSASVLVRLVGTSTPVALYADSGYVTPLANPIRNDPWTPVALGHPGVDRTGVVTFFADYATPVEVVITTGPRVVVLPVHLVP